MNPLSPTVSINNSVSSSSNSSQLNSPTSQHRAGDDVQITVDSRDDKILELLTNFQQEVVSTNQVITHQGKLLGMLEQLRGNSSDELQTVARNVWTELSDLHTNYQLYLSKITSFMTGFRGYLHVLSTDEVCIDKLATHTQSVKDLVVEANGLFLQTHRLHLKCGQALFDSECKNLIIKVVFDGSCSLAKLTLAAVGISTGVIAAAGTAVALMPVGVAAFLGITGSAVSLPALYSKLVTQYTTWTVKEFLEFMEKMLMSIKTGLLQLLTETSSVAELMKNESFRKDEMLIIVDAIIKVARVGMQPVQISKVDWSVASQPPPHVN